MQDVKELIKAESVFKIVTNIICIKKEGDVIKKENVEDKREGEGLWIETWEKERKKSQKMDEEENPQVRG